MTDETNVIAFPRHRAVTPERDLLETILSQPPADAAGYAPAYVPALDFTPPRMQPFKDFGLATYAALADLASGLPRDRSNETTSPVCGIGDKI